MALSKAAAGGCVLDRAVPGPASAGLRWGSRVMCAGEDDAKQFTYADLREHASRSDAWIAVHGKVYDVTTFARRHPGGEIIYQGLGIDATILFEAHHNMVGNRKGLEQVLAKHHIGHLAGYKPVAKFDSPFATAVLERVRSYVDKRTAEAWWIGRRWDALSTLSGCVFFAVFSLLAWRIFATAWLPYYAALGVFMSAGHVLGHAANHYSLSEYSAVNGAVSCICTNLWGLRETHWTFSHLISHHCYNYAERDYMIEQHVPTRYFRTRPEEPWKPAYRYQHWVYVLSPAMAFVMGAMRWDCAPWCVAAPVLVPLLKALGALRSGESTVAAPQFTASGSTHAASELRPDEAGVGMNKKFVVRESAGQALLSLAIANCLFMPMFLVVGRREGWLYAFLAQSLLFGMQSATVIKSLLVQHLSEEIVLKTEMTAEDDWYAMQCEASTSVRGPFLRRFMSYGIDYQTEHHMFPCMSPQLLHEVAPIVQATAEEFGVLYHAFPNLSAAQRSVFQRFKNLSVKPADLVQ